MSLLTESLEQILIQLEHKDPKIAASLQPGLTCEEIDEIVKNLPFKLPEEVYELYQWRNGMSEDVGFGLNTYNGISGIFHSLKLAIKYFNKYKKRGCTSNFLFLFSFIHEIGGDFYSVSLDDTTYPIFSFTDETNIKTIDISFVKTRTISSNLTTLMYSVAECLKDAMYSDTDSDGYTSLEYDEEKLNNIFDKYRQGNLKIQKD
ncbi:PBS lyase HEAT-like repeat protein [Calothrix parasitica NIES-267]|uniref:PBS lyase HEAT-like repeat protein n=1 Tax=Calothrix parasitica NIES-267 TaxID=1973488 RepID=A0A1Z4LND9_9CYAN|nr:PBS lyase HEAT-like repeat protein [Calothrix parasitica NIES-267]